MSQENVEVMRQVIARFNRDGFLPEDLFDPDVELFNIRESPLPGPYRGYEGLREWREAVFEVIEEGRFEIGDMIDIDEAALVVYEQRLLGRAKHTGMKIDVGWTTVSWFREGRIHRSESFMNHTEALKAAGLSGWAMSQENVENLRAFLEAWDVQAWKHGGFDVSLLDPEVTYEDTVLPDHIGETYRGHEGVIRATERWIEPYEDMTIELERIVGAGDRLVSIHRVRGTARYTGIEGEGHVAYVWTFRDRKVIHFQSYREPAEALEAVGLSE